jgi:hypothetical protein
MENACKFLLWTNIWNFDYILNDNPPTSCENGYGIGYGSFCAKTRFDESFRAPCCLGSLTGQEMQLHNYPQSTSIPVDATELACDPTWCVQDQDNACLDVFAQECNAAVQWGGTTVNAMLGDPTSACGQWYRDALAGNAPFARWPVIDTITTQYCSNPANAADTTSCACFTYSESNLTSNSYYYTNYPSSTCPDQLCPVRQIDVDTGNTLNLSDYACIAPQCQGAVADVSTLVTSDIWYAQRQQTCPQICLQVVTDGSVILNGDVITGGIEIDVNKLQCAGAAGSTNLGQPLFQLMPSTLSYFWPIYSQCASPPCCPPIASGGCTQTMNFTFGIEPTSPDAQYTVSVNPPFPAGVQFADPSLLQGTLSNANENEQLSLDLLLSAAHLAPGLYSSTVTVADTRYAAASVASVFQLRVADASVPAPPQAPPGPNPCTGPAVQYVDKEPTWPPLVLGILLFAWILVLVRTRIYGSFR